MYKLPVLCPSLISLYSLLSLLVLSTPPQYLLITFFCSPFIVSTPLHHLILTKICEEGWETQIIVPIFQMRNFSLALLNSAKVVPCWYIHILETE